MINKKRGVIFGMFIFLLLILMGLTSAAINCVVATSQLDCSQGWVYSNGECCPGECYPQSSYPATLYDEGAQIRSQRPAP